MELNNTIDDFWKEEILRFLKGELNVASEKAFLQWLNSDTYHQETFEHYRNIYISNISHAGKNDNINLEEKWAAFQDLKNRNIESPKQNKQGQLYYWMRVAAIFILLLVLGAISYKYLYMSGADNEHICEIVTPLGSKSQITLPDGTVVWLNAGTKLSYSKSYGKTNRTIYLEGEIFCKVVTDKKKPFIVRTSLIDVIATGTTFNVKAYSDDKTISTTLVEGIVKIEAAKKGKGSFSYTLKPQQSIVFTKPGRNKNNQEIETTGTHLSDSILNATIIKNVFLADSVNTSLYTSWAEQGWIIEGIDLCELSKLLERKYDVKIILKSEELKNFRFSGVVRNETLEQVLEILSLTTPLHYQIGKGEVVWDIDSSQANSYKNVLKKR